MASFGIRYLASTRPTVERCSRRWYAIRCGPHRRVNRNDTIRRSVRCGSRVGEDVGLVSERTRQINRLRWHLHELDPEFDVPAKGFAIRKQRRRTGDWLSGRPGLVAELARDVLADIDAGSAKIEDLEKRITILVQDRFPHLLSVPGCGPLSAAKIAGETANISRFRSEACFAMNSGVAPLPVWSGSTRGRVRMSRTGNRQLNAALHRVAVTQIRLDGLGQAYYRKRLDQGDSKVEALRCLKRRLARVIFNSLHADQRTPGVTARLPLAA